MKKECEKVWAINKYFVLSKSQKIYLEIREYLKQENPDLDILKSMINETKTMPENKQAFVNAVEHMWGYFKKQARREEKEDYLLLIHEYRNDHIEKETILQFFQKMLKKYPNEYLKNSNILSEK